MAKREAPKDVNLIIDDTAIEMATDLLKEFNNKYLEAMSREPTTEELQYFFSIGFCASAAGGI